MENYDLEILPGYNNVFKVNSYVASYYTIDKAPAEIHSLNNNLQEYKEKHNLESPTFDEERQFVTESTNIPEKYKDVFIRYLNRLEEVTEGKIDLALFHDNIKNLKIEIQTLEQLNANRGEDENVNTLAAFSPKNKMMYLQENAEDSDIWHEANHMLTLNKQIDYNYIKGSDRPLKKVDSYSHELFVCKKYENEYSILEIGRWTEEAIAELLTSEMCHNGKDYDASAYMNYSNTFKHMLNLADISLLDYIQKGGTSLLITELQNNGVDNAIKYINEMDVFFNTMSMKSEVEWCIDNDEILRSMYLDYAEDAKLKGLSNEEIIKKYNEGTEKQKIASFYDKNPMWTVGMISSDIYIQNDLGRLNDNIKSNKLKNTHEGKILDSQENVNMKKGPGVTENENDNIFKKSNLEENNEFLITAIGNEFLANDSMYIKYKDENGQPLREGYIEIDDSGKIIDADVFVRDKSGDFSEERDKFSIEEGYTQEELEKNMEDAPTAEIEEKQQILEGPAIDIENNTQEALEENTASVLMSEIEKAQQILEGPARNIENQKEN